MSTPAGERKRSASSKEVWEQDRRHWLLGRRHSDFSSDGSGQSRFGCCAGGDGVGSLFRRLPLRERHADSQDT